MTDFASPLRNTPIPVEEYQWADLLNYPIRGHNPARSTLVSPAMMVGLRKLVRVNIYQDEMWQNKTIWVTFDEAYIVSWINQNMITPLLPLGWKVLLSLFTKAYAPYRSPGRVRAAKSKAANPEDRPDEQ